MAQMVETFDRSLNPDAAPPSDQKEAVLQVKALMADHPALKKFSSKAVAGVSEAHRPTLASRLSRLDKQTGAFLRTELTLHADWKTDIASVRNSVVHGLPSSAFFLKNVIPLQISFDILMILFEARLLVAFGFDQPTVREIMTKNPHWWGQSNHISKHVKTFEDFSEFVP
nr:HEPN domain-containing protein [Cryobacterium zongtaii]